jgi:hypothetical protein
MGPSALSNTERSHLHQLLLAERLLVGAVVSLGVNVQVVRVLTSCSSTADLLCQLVAAAQHTWKSKYMLASHKEVKQGANRKKRSTSRDWFGMDAASP